MGNRLNVFPLGRMTQGYRVLTGRFEAAAPFRPMRRATNQSVVPATADNAALLRGRQGHQLTQLTV
jgi:hypothetical protein